MQSSKSRSPTRPPLYSLTSQCIFHHERKKYRGIAFVTAGTNWALIRHLSKEGQPYERHGPFPQPVTKEQMQEFRLGEAELDGWKLPIAKALQKVSMSLCK